MIKGDKSRFIEKQLTLLNKIHELHKQLSHIDKSLEKLYPVTIVEEDIFFVFDLDATGEKYELKLKYPTPMKMPSKVLAAFVLDFYNMKPSAIVSKEVFESLEGYVFVFHEFVHCYQWEKCEYEIKKSLEIEKISKAENNFMWEINHPFPYENSIFINKTLELDNFLEEKDYNGIFNYFKYMKSYLNNIDFEYMIWQQWKEGFARYIENKIRKRLEINLNFTKLQTPFNRVCFYEIGSRYIDLLVNMNVGFKNDIDKLYYKMVNIE